MDNCWTITKDLIDGEAVGVCGPRACGLSAEEIAAHQDATRFRLKDDDGAVYYEGVLVGGDGFEPLDDFGTPNAGCTSIELWERKDGAHRWCIL